MATLGQVRATQLQSSSRAPSSGQIAIPHSVNENTVPAPTKLPCKAPASTEVPDAWPEGFAEILDRSVHALAARLTSGLSPAALAGAYMDWAVHLASSPGKQLELASARADVPITASCACRIDERSREESAAEHARCCD